MSNHEMRYQFAFSNQQGWVFDIGGQVENQSRRVALARAKRYRHWRANTNAPTGVARFTFVYILVLLFCQQSESKRFATQSHKVKKDFGFNDSASGE
jgi:hypothetical protein